MLTVGLLALGTPPAVGGDVSTADAPRFLEPQLLAQAEKAPTVEEVVNELDEVISKMDKDKASSRSKSEGSPAPESKPPSSGPVEKQEKVSPRTQAAPVVSESESNAKAAPAAVAAPADTSAENQGLPRFGGYEFHETNEAVEKKAPPVETRAAPE